MSKFKAGDRVAVYIEHKRYVGVIEKIPPIQGLADCQLYVSVDGCGVLIPHFKQCRLLKPKKKREERWIKKCVALDSKPIGAHVLVPICTEERPGEFQSIRLSTDGWVKFREVREK